MGPIVGFLSMALMVMVLIVAIGSLIFVGSLPLARLRQRLRRAPEPAADSGS